MCRLMLFISVFLISTLLFAQDIVINEVLYDPIGSDGGYEWIELYNASDETIDLTGWQLQKAGSNFETIFIIDSLVAAQISPESYFLIGEEFVPDCDLIEDLAFQNGGSATDGIRLLSPDSLFTDTVLYDFPNSNNLPDDVSNPSVNFAVDVAGGNSLARIQNGIDSNNCELDFFECSEPTPGEANFYPIDLAIYELEIIENSGEYWLETMVYNLSTLPVDNQAASLEITINNSSYDTFYLPAIPAGDSISFSQMLSFSDVEYCIVEAHLNFYLDNELDNNFAATSILLSENPLILNEVLFKPASDNQEWLEIFNRSDCGYDVDNLLIIDASGSEISFDALIEPQGFLAVCLDPDLLLQRYPISDPNLVVEASEWTSLNNTEETLTLQDEFGTIFDSLYYDGGDCPADFSIERVDPFDDENIQWLACEDSLGGTPTLENSVLPLKKDLELNFLEIGVEASNVRHEVHINNIGLDNIEEAELNCYISNLDYPAMLPQFSEVITFDDSNQVIFNTDIPESGYYMYIYRIESDEDLNDENNEDYSLFNNNALPFVINEIMYAPEAEMPEWLEIKLKNHLSEDLFLNLVVDTDTLEIEIPPAATDYLLVTNSIDDADTLRAVYDLENVPIATGLPSLSNQGETLSIIDGFGNLIESFYYNPNWSDEMKGISIERINCNLPANDSNWGPSVSGCTPGAENSIFVEIIPAAASLSVDPNPFSPFRGEHTIFSFKLPHVISRVTIRIFDLKGRLVKKLVNQQLMSSSGSIVWNGKDKNNRNLPVGVYIVVMEAVSYESEKVYKKKITVVIGK